MFPGNSEFQRHITLIQQTRHCRNFQMYFVKTYWHLYYSMNIKVSVIWEDQALYNNPGILFTDRQLGSHTCGLYDNIPALIFIVREC